MWDIKGKTVLITGATSGIGKETAKELAKLGARVCFTSRNEEKGIRVAKEISQLSSNVNVFSYFCDLKSFESIHKFVNKFKSENKSLHILINNAGTWNVRREITDDGIEATIQVNYLAPAMLSILLLGLLKESAPSRIINVSSAMHGSANLDLDDLEQRKRIYNGILAYSNSKLALILFTKVLARTLKDKKITVKTLHPGLVRTNIFRNLPKSIVKIILLGALTPEEGARTSIFLATSDEVTSISGEYFANEKLSNAVLPLNWDKIAEKLWNMTLNYFSKYLSGLDVNKFLSNFNFNCKS